MLVVMQEGAPETQVQQVIDRLVMMGFTVHRSTGVTHTVLGGVGPLETFDPAEFEVLEGVQECHRIVSPYKLANKRFRPQGTVVEIGNVKIGGPEVVVMAGPCSVENEEQIEICAALVAKAGAKVIRGGAFKPRSSPYSFQGLGEVGLKMLRTAADRHGLLVVSEVMDRSQITLLVKYSDILQVGARNMQNFTLLRDLGKSERAVLVKRGLSATVDEWLMAAEYVMSGGNDRVIVCERGVRAYETYTRNTLDLNAVAVAKAISHLPVIVDPSHAVGVRDKVIPLARAAIAAGADGLLVEVHYDPERAICDGPQSLFPEQFAALAEQLRLIASAVGRSL